jgi:hypothetical protein
MYDKSELLTRKEIDELIESGRKSCVYFEAVVDEYPKPKTVLNYMKKFNLFNILKENIK